MCGQVAGWVVGRVVGWVGGWVTIWKIMPLCGPILQAETCQRFSAELRFQDRAECGNNRSFKDSLTRQADEAVRKNYELLSNNLTTYLLLE